MCPWPPLITSWNADARFRNTLYIKWILKKIPPIHSHRLSVSRESPVVGSDRHTPSARPRLSAWPAGVESRMLWASRTGGRIVLLGERVQPRVDELGGGGERRIFNKVYLACAQHEKVPSFIGNPPGFYLAHALQKNKKYDESALHGHRPPKSGPFFHEYNYVSLLRKNLRPLTIEIFLL